MAPDDAPRSRTCLIAAALLLLPVPARADETAPPADVSVSGSVDFASQNRYRGLALSDNRPSVEATATVSHTTGLYGGIWAATTQASPAIAMADHTAYLFAGWSGALGHGGLTFDAGARSALFFGSTRRDPSEIYASLSGSLGPASARLGIDYAPQQGAFDGLAVHHSIHIGGALDSDISGTPLHVHGQVGHSGGALDFTRAYWDYRLGMTATHKRLSLDLSLTGTDLTRADTLAAAPSYGASADSIRRASRSVVVATLGVHF